ncbi:Glu/Leu/Phe/Val dehydrogenase dimerization domain-containing protein [Streptomyces sp. LE64]|uniref:Glu/Leu/Phe/Val dehydrogenase dimerization domain-containing protein n=1 Tax=Streptomyces sp. LE64 TaxID=3448653 RepID=UPI004041B6B1
MWTDHVTSRRGYFVVDRLVRGVASGGLRMRRGCTSEEVTALARGMTVKEALRYDPKARSVPLGGAQGGIDCDPRDPAAYGVLVRFLRAVRPYVERCWTTGEDLGLSQETVDRASNEAGLVSSVQAVYPLLDDAGGGHERLADACAVEVDGIGLAELVGGCGVAEAVLTALDHGRTPYAGTRVAVQGFGTMGGATARFLARAGLTVVAVCDDRGALVNPSGLDVEALLAARDGFGTVDRSALREGDREMPGGDAWLSVDADVLVPAALSHVIDGTNQHRVTARWIVEAANMPVLPAAESLMAGRGIAVLPDVVANSATHAWWWWTLSGDLAAEPEAVFARVRTSVRESIGRVLARAEADGTSARAAAHALAGENLAEITERFGAYD